MDYTPGEIKATLNEKLTKKMQKKGPKNDAEITLINSSSQK
jgi:hypothetical protein